MNQERKCYETKSFNNSVFYDYWDLGSHPLYVLADKKFGIPYMKWDEEYFTNSTKVNSLTAIRRYLDKVNWTGEAKYCKHINKVIQISISGVWTPL